MRLEALSHALVVVLQKQGRSVGYPDGLKNAIGKEETPVFNRQPSGFREQLSMEEEVRHVGQS